MIVATTLSILVSGAMIAILGARDPKRLRNLEYDTDGLTAMRPLPSVARRACAWFVLVPGLILTVQGHWWAFFIWLGATCALGWVTSQVLGIGDRARRFG